MVRPIICISALFALSLSLSAQGHPSGPEKDTAQIQEAAVDVHEGQGRTVRGFCASVPLDDSQAEFADVFAFFDPATGAFWWKETGRSANSEVSSNAVENFLKFVSVRIADKKLVVFWTTDMPATLIVKESMLRVDKLEDAWRVVKQEVPHQPYGLDAEDDPKAGVHVIPLQKLLKEEFFVPKGYERSATRPFHPPNIRAIEHRDSQWRITLGGANGLTETPVLDDQYRLVGPPLGLRSQQ